MLKGAIIGFSRAVETVLVPAFLLRTEGLRLAAAADPDPARLAKARRTLPGAAAFYSRPGDLFSREERLDFAVVSSPLARRMEHIALALANKAHVLCEKPLCQSVKDWDRVRNEAAKAGRCVFTADATAKYPQMAVVKKSLDNKLLGRVSYASVEVLRPADGSPSGGILAECGWEAVRLLRELTRLEPQSLAAKIGRVENGGFEETADMQLHCAGATAHIHLSRGHHAGRFRAIVCGTEGLIELNGDTAAIDIKVRPAETLRFGGAIPCGPEAPAYMAAALDDFALEMTDPERRGADIAEAGRCVRIIKNAFYSDSMNSAAVPM